MLFIYGFLHFVLYVGVKHRTLIFRLSTLRLWRGGCSFILETGKVKSRVVQYLPPETQLTESNQDLNSQLMRPESMFPPVPHLCVKKLCWAWRQSSGKVLYFEWVATQWENDCLRHGHGLIFLLIKINKWIRKASKSNGKDRLFNNLRSAQL